MGSGKAALPSATTSSHIESWKVQPGRAFSKWLSLELTLLLQTSTTQGLAISMGAPRSAQSGCESVSMCPAALPGLQNGRPCAALNSSAELQVAPREQTLLSIEFKVSKFSLTIWRAHPPGAGFLSERHDWNFLPLLERVTVLQYVLPAYSSTARTWLVVKYVNVYCIDSRENHQKGLYSYSGNKVYHLCIMQSSQTHANKRETFTIICIFSIVI